MNMNIDIGANQLPRGNMELGPTNSRPLSSASNSTQYNDHDHAEEIWDELEGLL